MSYREPPTIATASLGIVAGNSSVTVIPAPGAGFALRVAFVNVSINRSSAGISDLTFADGLGNIIFRALGMQLSGISTLAFAYPEPGVQLNTNQTLALSATGSAVGTAACVVGYYSDQVA